MTWGLFVLTYGVGFAIGLALYWHFVNVRRARELCECCRLRECACLGVSD